MMKISFILTWLALTLAVMADAAPKIQFDRTLYDFGTTTLVESVTGTFTYQNTGTGVLQLQKPKPSCGCTVASVKPETLKPGEKGELVFTISLGASAVSFKKEIVVSSNDPQTPFVPLGIKVVTKSVMRAEPAGASFGELRLGTTTNATILVKRLDGKPLTITKVESSNSSITAKVDPDTTADAQQARVIITTTATGLPRQISEQVKIYTDDSRGAALLILIGASFLGDIKLEPSTIVWGMPDPAHWNDPDPDITLSRSMRVSATQPGQPLLLTNVTCDVKAVTVTLEALEEGQSYRIEASVAERLKESVKGTISFETNLPNLPKVEVPLEINLWRQ